MGRARPRVALTFGVGFIAKPFTITGVLQPSTARLSSSASEKGIDITSWWDTRHRLQAGNRSILVEASDDSVYVALVLDEAYPLTARAHAFVVRADDGRVHELNPMLAVQLTDEEALYTGVVAAGKDDPPFVHFVFAKGAPGRIEAGLAPDGSPVAVDLSPNGWGAAVQAADSRSPGFEF